MAEVVSKMLKFRHLQLCPLTSDHSLALRACHECWPPLFKPWVRLWCSELEMMSSMASVTKISSRWAIRVLSCNKLFWSSAAFHSRCNGVLYLASYIGNNVTNWFCDYKVTRVHGRSVIDSNGQVMEMAICAPPPNKNPYCSRSRNLQN
jgi:hypothetical protein